MKNVVVFGAAGHTGKYIVRKFREMKEVELTAFVRNPTKFGTMDISGVRIIQGDALNKEDVEKALAGQEIVLASLEGDVLTMAKNIISCACAKEGTVRRIIWITGMGIHHEIRGMRGKMLDMLAKSRPEYIEAADQIAGSGIPYTLLRCPGIQDGENTKYYLTTEAEQPRKKNVDRAAIAQCMADMTENETIGENESLGITN